MSETAGPDILIIAPGPLDLDRPGRNIRSLQLAHLLDGAGFRVTYALPNPEAFSDVRFHLATSEPESIENLLKRHQVVISSGLEYSTREVARRANIQIFDVADYLFSDLINSAATPSSRMKLLLDHADLILCGTPYQRDLWIGAAACHGRFASGELAERDPLELMLVMPYGHPGSEPGARFPRIKGVLEGIETTDTLLVWYAGYESLFDPQPVVTAMRGMAELAPNTKLLFLPPKRQQEAQSRIMEQLIEQAQHEQVFGTNVFFLKEEMTQKDYTDILCEADAAVCCTKDSADNRFWTAPEIVEAVWAQVPVVCTRGSFLASLVEDLHVGYAALPGDPVDIAESLVRISDSATAALMRKNMKEVHRHFSWEVAVRPLIQFLQNVPAQLPTGDDASKGGWGHAVRRVVSRFFE